MFDRIPKVTRSTACNDNGFAAVLGGHAVAPRGVLTAAARACELVLLSYVAQGSMIVCGPGDAPWRPLPNSAKLSSARCY